MQKIVGWILSGTHETGESTSNTNIYREGCFSQEPIDSTLNKLLKTESSEFSDTGNDCVETSKKNLIFNGSRYQVK